MRQMNLTMLLIAFISLHTAAQNNPTGKVYVALISESCGKMVGGGCMFYTSRVMSFSQDSVVISDRVRASCIPKERETLYEQANRNPPKSYKWRMDKDTLFVEGLTEYTSLLLDLSTVSGVYTLYGEQRTHVFRQEN